MMKKSIQIVLLFCLVFFAGKVNAQNVGINATGATPDASAGLDVDFTNKGLLMPRVALTGTTDATTITSPATSLLVYNTVTVSDVTPGFYYWSGSAWVKLSTGSGSAQPYQNIRGNVVTITSASYTVLSTDFLVVTNFNAVVTLTFPPLTNTAADIGRTIYVFNNNTAAVAVSYVGVTGGNTVTNQGRGRTFVWTGTAWVNIGT